MKPLIRYQHMPNGIHEVVFLEKTRASVDAFYGQMQLIYESSAGTGLVRLLVDLSLEGVIPMQYMFQESQNWRQRNPNNLALRGVILYPEKGVLPIAKILINAVLQTRGHQVKLHVENILKRDEALEWLLGDKA